MPQKEEPQSETGSRDFCGSDGSGWAPDGNWGEACAWHDNCYAAQAGKQYCDAMLGLLMTGVISIKELGYPTAPLKPAVTGLIYSFALIVSGLWEGGPSRRAYNRAGAADAMKTLDLILWVYVALYVGILLVVGMIAMDEGCLFNCQGASFGDDNPHGNPITWVVIVFLLWPVPLCVHRIAKFLIRLFQH